jgi:hypothetical protein
MGCLGRAKRTTNIITVHGCVQRDRIVDGKQMLHRGFFEIIKFDRLSGETDLRVRYRIASANKNADRTLLEMQ